MENNKLPKEAGTELPNSAPNEDGAGRADDEIFQDERDEHEELSEDWYEKEKKKRLSQFKWHVHWASIGVLWSCLVFYGFAVAVWFWHLVGPESWHFMPDGNFSVLQNLLFGTIVGGLISQFARKVFED